MKFVLLTTGFALIVGSAVIFSHCLAVQLRRSITKKPENQKNDRNR